MTKIEDILSAECNRQGVRATSDVASEMFTAAVGRINPQGLIALPAGSISVADFVASYRRQNPGSFVDAKTDPLELKRPTTGKRNLTNEMIAEIQNLRAQGLSVR